jgi:uracil-DNA glycosylase
MSDSVNLTRQLQLRLDSLKAAGVEHLPKIAPLQFEITPLASNDDEAEPADPLAARRIELEQLAVSVNACKKCPELFSTRTQTVFGVGLLNPDVCFVGEAPGADEDRLGEPFVGAAGQLLTRIINACGLTRSDVYICNTLKCRPPNNRTPTTDECKNCRPFFDRQLELVEPKVIVCLGGTAAKNVLNTSTGITKLRGQIYQYNSIPVICTYHPSYLLRLEGAAEKKAKGECWDDMKMMLNLIGRTVPGRS